MLTVYVFANQGYVESLLFFRFNYWFHLVTTVLMGCLGLGTKKHLFVLGQDHILITTRCSKYIYIYFFVVRKTTGNCPEFPLKNIWHCHTPVTPPQPTKTAHFHSSDIFCRFKLPTCSNGMKKLLKKCLTAGKVLLMHLCSLCPWMRANTNAKVQSVVDITALKSAK